jgi:hypothetical protein
VLNDNTGEPKKHSKKKKQKQNYFSCGGAKGVVED